MDELRDKYDRQLAEYDSLVNASLNTPDGADIPRLRTLNAAIAKTLDEMITKLTFMKKETPVIRSERDELLSRLEQIQKDYNGLLVTTDTLETLRRIRQQEGSESNRQLYMFFGFFLIVSLGIIAYLFFASQKKLKTAPRASMPPTAAALV